MKICKLNGSIENSVDDMTGGYFDEVTTNPDDVEDGVVLMSTLYKESIETSYLGPTAEFAPHMKLGIRDLMQKVDSTTNGKEVFLGESLDQDILDTLDTNVQEVLRAVFSVDKALIDNDIEVDRDVEQVYNALKEINDSIASEDLSGTSGVKFEDVRTIESNEDGEGDGDSDGNVDSTKYKEYESLPEADIIRPIQEKQYSKLIEQQFPISINSKEFIDAKEEAESILKDMVGESYADTRSGVRNTSTDPNKIMSRVKDKLRRAVSNFYLSQATKKIFASDSNNYFILPDSTEASKSAIPVNSELLFESDKGSIYTSKDVLGDNGKRAILASSQEVLDEYMEQKKLSVYHTADLSPTHSMGTLSRSLARDNMDDYRVRSAFYAASILSNFDMYIGNVSPALHKSYKARSRTNSQEGMMIGDQSVSKITPITIESIKMLPEGGSGTRMQGNLIGTAATALDPKNKNNVHITRIVKNALHPINSEGSTSIQLEDGSIVHMMNLNGVVIPIRINTIQDSAGNDIVEVSKYVVDNNNVGTISDLFGNKNDTVNNAEFLRYLNVIRSNPTIQKSIRDNSKIIRGNNSTIKKFVKNQAKINNNVLNSRNVPTYSFGTGKVEHLTEENFNAASCVFMGIDPNNFEAGLKNAVETRSIDGVDQSLFNQYYDILRSIYQTMYSPDPYIVQRMDPLTGNYVVEYHESHKTKTLLDMNDKHAQDVLADFEQTCITKMMQDKIMSENRVALITNLGENDAFSNTVNDVSTGGSVELSGVYFTNPEVFKKQAIKATVDGNIVTVTYGAGKSIQLQRNGNASKDGYAFTAVKNQKNDDGMPVTVYDMGEFAGKLGMMKVSDQTFLGELTQVMSGESQDPMDILANIIGLKLAAGNSGVMSDAQNAVVHALAEGLDKSTTSGENSIDFGTYMFKHKQELTQAMGKAFTPGRNKSTKTSEGETRDALISRTKGSSAKNLVKSVLQIIKNKVSSAVDKARNLGRPQLVGHLSMNSFFTSNINDGGNEYSTKYAEITTTLLNDGIKVEAEGRSMQKQTVQEMFTFLIDEAFAQQVLDPRSDGTKVALPAGVMSDRSSVTLNAVKLNKSEFIPRKAVNSYKSNESAFDLDSAKSMWDYAIKGRYNAMSQTVASQWCTTFNKIYNANTLKSPKFSKYAVKDIHGNPVNIDLARVSKIANAYNNNDSLTGMNELVKYLADLKIDYNQLSSVAQDLTSVLSYSGKSKKYTNAEGASKSGKICSLPTATLQMMNMVHDEAELENYRKRSYQHYKNSLKEVKPVYSESTLEGMMKRLNCSKEEAISAIEDSFFYQGTPLMDDILTFQGGVQEQFKPKGEFSLLAELGYDTDMDVINGQYPVDLIEKLKNTKVNSIFKNFKGEETISEVSDNQVLDQLGSKGSRISFLKAIVNTDSDLFPIEEKLRVIKFDDIASQTSSMYIDQTKRNQGVGTSQQMLKKNEVGMPGVFVSPSSNVATIDDPRFAVRVLGNAGFKSFETYDATQFASRLYMIRMNNAVGGMKSSYYSYGNGVKDINTSSSADGVSLLEKKLTAPTGYYESVINGTSEFNDMMNYFEDAIKFTDDGVGLSFYVDENLLNPTSSRRLLGDFKNKVENITLHGESLGTLMIGNFDNLPDAVKRYANKEKFIEAGALMNAYRQGNISKEVLEDIELYTPKKLVEGVNSMKDLSDAFGGIDADLDAINKTKANGTIESFVKQYPFGIVGHAMNELLGTYPGPDGKYGVRDLSVEKLTFTTAAKTGATAINKASDLATPQNMQHVSTPNDFSGIILSAYHNQDVTAKMSVSEGEEHGDNHVKIITQAIGAAVAEGRSINNVEKVLDAIGTISEVQMELVNSRIETLMEVYKSEGVTDEIEAYRKAVSEYAYDLLKTKLESSISAGPVDTIIAEGEDNPSSVPYSSKLLLPQLRSAINADINKRVVRLPWAGGQTIVGASQDQYKSYDFNGNHVFRHDINKEIFRRVHEKETLRTIAEETGITFRPAVFLETEGDFKSSLKKYLSDNGITDGDYIYHGIDDNIKAITPTKLRSMDEVQARSILESARVIFDKSAESPKAKDLKWLDYFDEEGSMFTTPEYKAYQLSGMVSSNSGLKKLSNSNEDELVKNQAFMDFINTELNDAEYPMRQGDSHVPSQIIVRALKGGDRSEVYSRDEITAAINEFNQAFSVDESGNITINESNQAAISKVRNWMVNMNKAKQSSLQYEMFKILENSERWTSTDCEFYTSPMHKGAFCLETGDSMFDIVGLGKNPDINALFSAGGIKAKAVVVNSSYTELNKETGVEDTIKRTDTYNRTALKELLSDGFGSPLCTAAIEKLRTSQSSEVVALLDQYVIDKTNQVSHMNKFFSDKLVKFSSNIQNKTFSKNADYSSKSEVRDLYYDRFPELFLDTNATPENIIKAIDALLDEFPNDFNLSYDLEALKNNIELEPEEVRNTVAKFKESRISLRAGHMANNFLPALTFFTARIPGTGKQSGMAARVKNFIYTTQNTTYGPVELIDVNGAD